MDMGSKIVLDLIGIHYDSLAPVLIAHDTGLFIADLLARLDVAVIVGTTLLADPR
jgi:hypothetical protein